MKKIIAQFSVAALLATSSIVVAQAEETVGEKAATVGRDAQLETKKGWNKTKKTARNATGNKSRKKDAAEKTDETTDAVGNKVEETKDKID